MKRITTSLILLIAIHSNAQTKKDSTQTKNIDAIEIFGDSNKKQKGIESITRFPVNPQLIPQSISVISEKLIEEQGALTVADVARNIPGVTLFGSYGGNRESMSIRGYRGTPVLKNGIRMDSDFRTAAGVFDMQGIESVQVIRGAAAITQGIGNGLGSGGGLINLVTKTPRYTNETEVGLRYGSWNFIRGTVDAQRVVGKNKNIAVRVNTAYEDTDSYRDIITKNKFYLNPSISWKIDNKTELIAEMDYLDGKATPDRGTVNIKPNTENGLVDMGSRFLGFKNDVEDYNVLSYSARITRELTDKINLRAAFMANEYKRDVFGVALTGSGETRKRSLNRNYKQDNNNTLQIDVMGKDFRFGKFKWEWQFGYDVTKAKGYSQSAATGTIDTINVLQPINYDTHYTINDLTLGDKTHETISSYGFMTQQHLTYNDKFKFVGAIRYSYATDYHKGAVDPMVGLMYLPTKNLNLYTSYATVTSLRQMGNAMVDGSTSGPAVTDQFEAGIKTSWFNDRFRANMNYFYMNQDNLTVNYYNYTIGALTDLYEYAGNLKRTGFEAEISGRPISNLQVLLGYSYTDASYHNSPAYVEGSRPMNSPYNTANVWAQYTFQNTKTFLDGAYVALGYYYIGSRPINEQSKSVDAHGNWNGGAKQFLMPEYYTLNAQIGYKYKDWTFRMLLNNITDRLGYNSYYRGGYINQIDPFNISGQIVFKF